MPSDVSAAGNPLPSDRTPGATSPATTAVYKRYQELIAYTARQAATPRSAYPSFSPRRRRPCS